MKNKVELQAEYTKLVKSGVDKVQAVKDIVNAAPENDWKRVFNIMLGIFNGDKS